jgi:hypothetical protein
MTTERVLQRKIIDYLNKSCNSIVVKTDSTSTRGWPDLTVVSPTGEVHFIEVKTTTGKLSVHQQRIHQQLKEQNANVHTIRSVEEVQRLFNK